MASLEHLAPGDLRRVVLVFHRVLAEHREHLNGLNVYPVPDADTGANLASTIGAVVDALPAGSDPDMAAVCEAIRRGSMLGARGASGVITSQLLGALVGSFEDRDRIGGRELAAGLDAATSAAYRAVLTPAEGTILTVLRAAASAARRTVEGGEEGLGPVAIAARDEAASALARTPDLLPALRVAGVVDAGGSGLLLLFDALLNVVADRPLPAPPPSVGRVEPVPVPDDMPRFEVVVRLDAPAEVMSEFRLVWDRLGNESTVIVEGRGDWVCHIHTGNPEAAIEAARAAGEIHDVQVTDLFEQVTRLRAARVSRPAVIAVALGPGLQRRFLEMGASGVVAGGAGRNPSTAELVQAVDATGAPEVLLLPNDPNVVPAAEQVRAVTGRVVRVIPTLSMSAGLAAMRAYDPRRPDGAAERMGSVAGRVVSGGVTTAVRDADTPEGRVAEGTWIARTPDGGFLGAASAAAALRALIDRLADGSDPSRVEILLGAEADDGIADSGRRHAVGRWPDAEVTVIDGGQPLYPYLVAVERPPAGDGG